jgi:hypothetical protein
MKIEIDARYIPILSAALGELPYKIAAPLVSEINQQIIANNKNEYSTPLDENGIEITQ